MISEQTLLRYIWSNVNRQSIDIMIKSFKKKDKPIGFPEEFRKFARYGQQKGKTGKPTYFYSQVYTFTLSNFIIQHNGRTFWRNIFTLKLWRLGFSVYLLRRSRMILYQNYAVNHFLDLCCLAMVSTPKWKGSILVIRYEYLKPAETEYISSRLSTFY